MLSSSKCYENIIQKISHTDHLVRKRRREAVVTASPLAVGSASNLFRFGTGSDRGKSPDARGL